MKEWNYSVKYKRTLNWWGDKGDWYQISTWLNATFGSGEWEYINECFVFQKESNKRWFLLRWS